MATYTIPISIRINVEATSRAEAAEVAWQVTEAIPRRIIPILTSFGVHRPQITVDYESIVLTTESQEEASDTVPETPEEAL